MTADDYEIVERLVAECANALGIERPPAVFVPGASCVEIDMSRNYGRASDVSRLRRVLAASLAAKGLLWVVTRTSLRSLSVSDRKTQEVESEEDSESGAGVDLDIRSRPVCVHLHTRGRRRGELRK